jgi:hypothetical protein
MSRPSSDSDHRALLGLAGVLIVIFLGVGLFELKSARVESAKVAQLTRQHAAAEERLRQLEQSAPAAVPAPEPVPTPPNSSREDARAKLLADRAAAQAYAKAFFAKYPQARAMLVEYQTRNMENYYAPFFRAAGMSQTQIDQFIARTAQVHLDSLQLNPAGSWSNGQPNLSAEEMRATIGDAGYQHWQDAIRAMPAQNWIDGLSSSVRSGAPSLSSDQAIQLSQIVANNSPDYVAGKRVNPGTVDLDGFIAQAKSVMTDAQWQQAQPYLLLQTANRQLQSLMQGSQ